MNQTSESQIAYIAGFWDGEGTLGIWATRRKNHPMPCYFLAGIQAGNTNLAVLESIQSDLGIGTIGRYRPTNPRGKSCYKLTISQREAEPFVRAMLPFLRIKNRQAELILEFLKLQQNCGRGGFSESVWQAQKALYIECGPLNHRGTGFFFPNQAYQASFADKISRPPRPYPKRKPKGRLCDQIECSEKHYAKGMCFTHYRKNNPQIYGYKKDKWVKVGVRGKIDCLNCGKEYEYLRRTPRFCSAECRSEYGNLKRSERRKIVREFRAKQVLKPL